MARQLSQTEKITLITVFSIFLLTFIFRKRIIVNNPTLSFIRETKLL